MKKITIITGATASGKTALSLEYAKAAKNASIINADASAIYKNFSILTAQPSAEDQMQFPHFMFEIAEVVDDFSVAKWLSMVHEILESTEGEKIIVGGTCMYIYLLINGLVEMEKIDEGLRKEATQRFEEVGYEEFLNEVLKQDPLSARDSQRLINNYCLLKQTGKSFTEWQKQPKKFALPKESYNLVKVMPPRTEVYQNCNIRFEKMLEDGAIEEVERAIEIYGRNSNFKKIIGAGEIKDYLEGLLTFEAMKEKVKQKTRNLAKSQITWLNNKI